MITYENYTDRYGDELMKEEFESLLSSAVILLQAYAESFISQFRLEERFEEYGIDIDEAVLYQIHFSNAVGGNDIYSGISDMNIESVTTSGFNFRYKNDKCKFFKGAPISPMAEMIVLNQLRKKGYLNKCIYYA